MEHFNKQLEVKLELLESENSRSRKKTFMEGINIMILIILGCGGLYIYSNIIAHKEPPVNFSEFTSNTIVTNEEKTLDKSPIPNKIHTDQLIIGGHPEVGEKITIAIDGYNKKANYKIDFGDGKNQAVKAKKISHIYKKAGIYTIQLSMSYQDEPTQTILKKIDIDSPIEVDQNAYNER